ncbi:MAG TPA: response regulator [Syntrophales bacterium]|nr:response regulator [Syntrophales bacterium]
MKILVVDDEIDEVESLNRGLRSKGYHVLQALNAQEALNHLCNDATRIDLVITDYAMPMMNGMDLLRDIRKNHGNLPVIMMTAYGKKDLIIDALRNRCDCFIEKPFTLEQLLNEIERVKAYILQNMSLHQLSESIPMFVHQIKNPLACINGSAEIAIHKLNDSEAIKKCIERIIASVDRITVINKEMLETIRPDEVKMEIIEIKSVIDDCLVMFKDVLTLKDICIENHISRSSLHVLGRKFDLEQLFRNLVSNSIDSMNGRPQKLLKIQAEANEDPFSISISIEDTGCGISEQEMKNIFTPYFTLKKNGTGLGLAVVKKVIEEHKGKIEVKSVVGTGTTFIVTLPSL